MLRAILVELFVCFETICPECSLFSSSVALRSVKVRNKDMKDYGWIGMCRFVSEKSIRLKHALESQSFWQAAFTVFFQGTLTVLDKLIFSIRTHLFIPLWRI